MLRPGTSYSELILDLRALSRERKNPRFFYNSLIHLFLNDRFLLKMAEIYGVPNEFKPIVYDAIYHRWSRHAVYGGRPTLEYYQLDRSIDIFTKIQEFLVLYKDDLDLIGSLEQLEESRYQKRLKMQVEGHLQSLQGKQSIEDIFSDLQSYLLSLKEQKVKAKTVHILLQDIVQRIEMLSVSKEKQKNLIFAFFRCLDSARTLLHRSPESFFKERNYPEPIQLERLLYSFLEIFVFSRKIGLYSIEQDIMALHDPFISRFIAHDRRRHITKPSDLLYHFYLDAAGYKVKKITQNAEHTNSQQVLWELVKPSVTKTENEIYTQLLRAGPFLDQEHLKNILCLQNLEGSLTDLAQMADNGTVPPPQTLLPKDYFIPKYNQYIVSHGFDLYHYFHVGISLSLLSNQGVLRLCCTESILCKWFSRYALSPSRYEELAVLCVKQGYARALSLLLRDYNVNPDCRDSISGRNLIVLAVEYGDVDTVRVLVDNNATVNLLNAEGEPLFFLAANKSKNIEILSLLIAKSNTALKNRYGQNLLMVLSQEGHVEGVRALVRYPMIFEARDPYGRTALMIAAEYRHVDIIRILKAAGADINARQEPFKWDCDADRLQMLDQSFLILSNINALRNALLHHSQTALMQAASRGDETTVVTLIEEGASLEAKDKHNRTALVLAAQQGHQNVVELLLAKGAWLNLEDIRNTKKDDPQQHWPMDLFALERLKEKAASVYAFLEGYARKTRLEQHTAAAAEPDFSALMGSRVRLFSEYASDDGAAENKKTRRP